MEEVKDKEDRMVSFTWYIGFSFFVDSFDCGEKNCSLTTGHYETESYRCQPIFSEGLNLIIQFAGFFFFFFFFFFFLSSHSGDQARRSFFQNIGVVGSTTLAG